MHTFIAAAPGGTWPSPCCQMTYSDLQNVGRNITPRFRARVLA